MNNYLTMMLRPSFPKKQGNHTLFVFLFTFLCCAPSWSQHLVGVRSGYNISGIDYQRNDLPKTIPTYLNFSFLYTYYHPMWDQFPFFGLQVGVNYSEQGYCMPGLHSVLLDTTRYRVLTIPVVSQFHIDFWKMRLLVNLGAFGGYRLSAKESFYEGEHERINRDYAYDCYDIRVDYGFIGGGGLSYRANPFEIHLECNYHYSLSMLYHPKKISNASYIYIYPHQLLFSVALHYQFKK